MERPVLTLARMARLKSPLGFLLPVSLPPPFLPLCSICSPRELHMGVAGIRNAPGLPVAQPPTAWGCHRAALLSLPALLPPRTPLLGLLNQEAHGDVQCYRALGGVSACLQMTQAASLPWFRKRRELSLTMSSGPARVSAAMSGLRLPSQTPAEGLWPLRNLTLVPADVKINSRPNSRPNPALNNPRAQRPLQNTANVLSQPFV